jgi:hypothetical protein
MEHMARLAGLDPALTHTAVECGVEDADIRDTDGDAGVDIITKGRYADLDDGYNLGYMVCEPQ